MAAIPDPPATLLSMEPPLLMEGPAEAAAAAAEVAKRAASRGAAGAPIEDIINSILPPRCAGSFRLTTGNLGLY
jgi:hypothetical protein